MKNCLNLWPSLSNGSNQKKITALNQANLQDDSLKNESILQRTTFNSFQKFPINLTNKVKNLLSILDSRALFDGIFAISACRLSSTAKRKLERRQFSTSSLFAKFEVPVVVNLKHISELFGLYNTCFLI